MRVVYFDSVIVIRLSKVADDSKTVFMSDESLAFHKNPEFNLKIF